MPSNIGDVIGDVEDVKNDLEQNILTKMHDAMRELLDTALHHVDEDSDWTGGLKASIRRHGVNTEWSDDDTIKFTVGTDKNIAPYAPLVEFGTGERGKSGRSAPGAISAGKPDSYPAGYPYDSPDVEPEKLVGAIYEWVETKPVTPEKATMWDTAMAITRAIIAVGTYAHPFLRPAWFKNKLKLKRAARKAVRKSFR